MCGFALNGTKNFSNAQHAYRRGRKTLVILAGHLILNLSANLAQPMNAVKVVAFGLWAATPATSRHQKTRRPERSGGLIRRGVPLWAPLLFEIVQLRIKRGCPRRDTPTELGHYPRFTWQAKKCQNLHPRYSAQRNETE